MLKRSRYPLDITVSSTIPQRKWFKIFIPLPNGIPAHNTCGRVPSRLDPAQLEQRFQRWMGTIAESSVRCDCPDYLGTMVA